MVQGQQDGPLTTMLCSTPQNRDAGPQQMLNYITVASMHAITAERIQSGSFGIQ